MYQVRCLAPALAGEVFRVRTFPRCNPSFGLSRRRTNQAGVPKRGLHRGANWVRSALAGVGVLLGGADRSMGATEPTAFIEDFAADPVSGGWRTFGEASLFRWNAEAQTLEVTWDSSKPNSYFYRPLGRTLTRRADFSLWFDLRLRDIAVGTTPGKPYTFELAIGFLNLAQATQPHFLRGTGADSPNLVEFDYFPDSGFGATISPTIISGTMQFATSFNSPLELTLNDQFRVKLRYDAAQEELTVKVTRNGEGFGPIKAVTLPPEFTDFQVDAVAVCSYSDAGQDPQFGGSVLARGVVDNLYVAVERQPTLDLRLTGGLKAGRWQAEFDAHPGWTYSLVGTTDLTSWTPVTSQTALTRGRLVLSDPAPATDPARFYRVEATAP